MSMFKYWGFGLHIASEMPFPELFQLQFFNQPDVTICLGELPYISGNYSFSTGRVSYTMNDQEMLFTVQDIGAYHISHGTQITMCPDNADSDKHALRTFILSAALPAILQQRQRMALHAASIIHDGRLTCISGHSGAGKSTTLAGLMKRNFSIFSDDVTVINEDSHGIASYPMMKLWGKTMETLDNAALNDRSYYILPGVEKYGVFFHEHFNTNAYPIANLILLKLSDDNRFSTTRLTGGDAFIATAPHMYKNSFYNSPDMRRLRFKTISQLLQHTAVYEIARPAGCAPDDLLARVTALI